MSNSMLIFCFLKLARQWTWIWRLDRKLTQLSLAVGTELSWCSCRSWAQTGGEAALQSLIGVALRGKWKWRCPPPCWAPLEDHGWAGARRAISLFSISESAAETLCSVSGLLKTRKCGINSHGSHWTIRRLEHRSHGARQQSFFQLENRRWGWLRDPVNLAV